MNGTSQWAVMMSHRPLPLGWGPFDDIREAERFAAFVTHMIDPAQVLPLRTAASELLTWWSASTELPDPVAVPELAEPVALVAHMQRPASDAPAMLGDVLAEMAADLAARAAYTAFQRARGVPCQDDDCGWQMLGQDARDRWHAVALAVLDAKGTAAAMRRLVGIIGAVGRRLGVYQVMPLASFDDIETLLLAALDHRLPVEAVIHDADCGDRACVPSSALLALADRLEARNLAAYTDAASMIRTVVTASE